MYDKWSNETTVAGILAKIESGCAHLKSPDDQKTCDKVAEVFTAIPPSLFKGMESLAWPVPLATCATIRKCKAPCCAADAPPEQVHLSLHPTDRTVMGVTWVTLDDKGAEHPTIVQWGTSPEGPFKQIAFGHEDTYTQAGWVGLLHKATMTDLAPATRYYYQVGSDTTSTAGWSQVFSFKTFDPAAPHTRFAVVADMAYDENSDGVVAHIEALVDAGEVDVVVHSGDIGYADGYEPHWDTFFNKVESIAARVPYMFTPGNHEFWYNFAAYKARFFLPPSAEADQALPLSRGNDDNMYYSWEYGAAHFLALNSETAIDVPNFSKAQLSWLDGVLEDKSGPEGTSVYVDRSRTPWLIAHFHRPMYCSDDHACGTGSTELRVRGEKPLHSAHTDLVLTGHVHAYERTLPVYRDHSVAAWLENKAEDLAKSFAERIRGKWLARRETALKRAAEKAADVKSKWAEKKDEFKEKHRLRGGNDEEEDKEVSARRALSIRSKIHDKIEEKKESIHEKVADKKQELKDRWEGKKQEWKDGAKDSVRERIARRKEQLHDWAANAWQSRSGHAGWDWQDWFVTDPYHNARAPVHILQGASGNREGNKGSYHPDNIEPWSAAQSTNIGFGLLTVHAQPESEQRGVFHHTTKTERKIEWAFFDGETGETLDSMVMTRDD
jgi:hypothetical protein